MNYKHYYLTPKYSETEKSYYGKITGPNELGYLSASTLDDLETLFHQKVDDHIEESRASANKRHFGWLIAIVCAVYSWR